MMSIYKNVKRLVPSTSLIKVSFYFHLQQLKFFVCKQQKLTLMNLRKKFMKAGQLTEKVEEPGISRAELRV